jgi:opacity protein-like surface antigen
MTNTKWLRRALLGGVALTVAGTAGARADELADLKAQLEALQSRVNTLEQQPAQQASNIPPGASFVTFERGSRMDFVAQDRASDRVNYNDDAGFTIAITPTADMPAPVAEIIVYGYVKGDVIYDVDGNDNHFSFSMPGQDRFDEDDDEFVFLHAGQSRFGIKSKVDTAVGQIRTRIELDFLQFGADGCTDDADGVPISSNFCPRMRQAYGEWDMTPNWTLLAGQTDQLATLSIIGVTLVDFFGEAGPNGGTRFSQVRLTYHDGPLTWAVGIERPEEASDTLIPGFGSFLQYDIAGGHQIIIAGGASDIDRFRPRSDFLSDLDPELYPDLVETPGEFFGEDDDHQLGWVVGAGVNINLADIATFTAGGQYTEGLATRWMNQLDSQRVVCQNDEFDGDVVIDIECDDLQRAFGVLAGLTFNINDTTTFNVEGGYAQNIDAEDNDLLTVDNVATVHANILWQPVKQMRLGWEVMWGRENFIDPIKIDDDETGLEDDLKICRVGNDDDEENGDCPDSSDALRFQFGAWFFF